MTIDTVALPPPPTPPPHGLPELKRQPIPKPRYHTQHIGNYLIHKKTLGSGSMGTVKLAESLSAQDHQLYAVKVMPKIDLDQAEQQAVTKDPKDTPREREQRTVREMAIMHLLRHPNICQLKEWIVHGDKYYMFLEYIEGGQLLDYIISHGKLREKLARKFARQIVSALDYCHRNSIVHRDLKIENILLTHQEEIKIIDFGLSNIYSPSRLLDTFCGSLYFAAPELLQARHYTGPEVDVWSLGVVLYVLVCGRVPFDDTSLPALHQKIKSGHVEYPDHLSRDCVDLLSKILVVDPHQRATLSQVIHHPWINKGYHEPIKNYLPHREPITSIDPQVVKGMQGFGLGQPEEIQARLEYIISSPDYPSTAAQVDHSEDRTRWRRSLSVRRPHHSHPSANSQPVLVDPFLSIYSLVKERQELDRKNQLLQSEGYQSPVQLGRSASTSLSKPNTTYQSHLTRRKTERVPPTHTRHYVFTEAGKPDWASPTRQPTPVRSTSNLLQRSRSAAKRLGAMLPNTTKVAVPEDADFVEPTSLSSTELPVSLRQKTINLFRSSSLSDRRRPWQKSATEGVDIVLPTVTGGRMIEEGISLDTPKMSAHPKSLFNFNRRHLFKVSTADMMKYIQYVLLKLGIRYLPSPNEPFSLRCELIDWERYQTFVMDEQEVPKEPISFTLMVYQARWAGGRLGVKVVEAEEEEDAKLYRRIYHTLLNQLGQTIKAQA